MPGKKQDVSRVVNSVRLWVIRQQRGRRDAHGNDILYLHQRFCIVQWHQGGGQEPARMQRVATSTTTSKPVRRSACAVGIWRNCTRPLYVRARWLLVDDTHLNCKHTQEDDWANDNMAGYAPLPFLGFTAAAQLTVQCALGPLPFACRPTRGCRWSTCSARTSHSPQWMASDEAATISHMTTPKRTRPSTCDCQCCEQHRLVLGGWRLWHGNGGPRCSRLRVLSASRSRSGGRRRPSQPLILVETSLSPTQTFHVEKCVCEMRYDLGVVAVPCWSFFCIMFFLTKKKGKSVSPFGVTSHLRSNTQWRTRWTTSRSNGALLPKTRIPPRSGRLPGLCLRSSTPSSLHLPPVSMATTSLPGKSSLSLVELASTPRHRPLRRLGELHLRLSVRVAT